MQSGSPTLGPCAQSLNVGVNSGNNDANGNNSGSGSGGSDRRRRSGVTAVMQRPGTVDYTFQVFVCTSSALYYNTFYITSMKIDYYNLSYQLV